MPWLSLDTVNYFLFFLCVTESDARVRIHFLMWSFPLQKCFLYYCRRKDNCTLLLYMHILCFQLTKGWKTLFVADLFSHSFCGPSALGSHCGLVIYRTIYHNIHGNHNWITPTLMWSQLKRMLIYMCSCIYMFVLYHAQIIMICIMSGSTVSLINSFHYAEMNPP